MPRQLILIPPNVPLAGTLAIGPGYPKPYTGQQMREWADAAARLRQIAEEDRELPAGQRRIDRWHATPRDQLDPEAKRVLEAHSRLTAQGAHGIRGALRPDGTIDLSDGRHRAHYMREKGEPVPVWVDAPDQQQLERLKRDCKDQLARERKTRGDRASTHPAGVASDGAKARKRPGTQVERGAGDEHGAVERRLGAAAVKGASARERRLATNLGRTALSEPSERHPEVRPVGERGESRHERGTSRGERGR